MTVTAQPDGEAAAGDASAGNPAARRTATGRSRAGRSTAGTPTPGTPTAAKPAPGDGVEQAGLATQAELAGQDAVTGHGGYNGRADAADEDAAQRDPWFEPEPNVARPDTPDPTALGQYADSHGSEGAAGNRQAEWFLPTGRAGLLPDSITESWDEDPDQVSDRPVTASAPPWASEGPTPAASKPPPWESGPWPGPGGGAPAGQAGADASPSQASGTAGAGDQGREDVAGRAAGRAADGDPAHGGPAHGGPAHGGPAHGGPAHGGPVTRGIGDDDTGPASWQAPAAVVAGIVPLVVPGLVLGILGLRRAGLSGSGRLAYWTAIGLSAVWAIVIVILVAGGSPAGGCAGYPASVRAAYTKAMNDINGKAPAAVQKADLASAALKANAAAADIAQIPVRAALFGMAGDLQQVETDVADTRPVPADVLAHLKSDGTTFPQSCPG